MNKPLPKGFDRNAGVTPQTFRFHPALRNITAMSPCLNPMLRKHPEAKSNPALLTTIVLILLGLLPLGYSSLILANPITDENALPGQAAGWADWDAGNRLVEAYASEVSLAPGDTLHLHVSTKPSASYRVDIFRIGWYGGDGARLMDCIPSCQTSNPTAGATQPMPNANPTTGLIDANWPITDSIPTGANWVSGYYIAKVRLTGSTSGAATVPFVVLPGSSRSKSALIQVPMNTWQAYNNWGGKSLYDSNSPGGRAYKVSFNRPYARTNWSLFDYEVQMVRFLEREGYDIAYQTEWDTHNNPTSLQGYQLLMPIGHGEYWTKEMRDGFDSARDSGINLAFFGSNIAYWQMRYEDSGRTLVEYRSAALDPQPLATLKTDQFRLLNPPRPECQLIGVQYNESNWGITGASFYRDFAINAVPLDDPWFLGTGFTAGDTLGLSVGYEWDFLTKGCKTPLAQVFFQYDGGSPSETAQVTRYIAPSGARIFSSGSMNWTWLLDDWFRTGDPQGHKADKRAQQFTRNVLNDLLLPRAIVKYPPVAMIGGDLLDPFVGMTATLLDQSADQDGTIVSRAWDLNGDGEFNEGSTASVQMSFPNAGVYTVGLRVTDDSGLSETIQQKFVAVSATIPNGNATLNPSFETGTTGWASWQGTLTPLSASAAVNGTQVAHVSYPKTQSYPSFTLSTNSTIVAQSVSGHSYIGNAWVRAGSSASVGKAIKLKIRESTATGTMISDTGGTPVILESTSNFQRISVIKRPSQANTQLDLRISMDPALPGDSFDADMVTLVDAEASGLINQAPKAAIQVPSGPVPMLQTVTLADNSTDPDITTRLARSWDLHQTGLFNEGSGPTASLIFEKPGTYPVSLKVMDQLGASDTATGTVTVVSCLKCPTNNLTSNPSFEVWTRGWLSQGAIKRIADSSAIDGDFVARVSGQAGNVFTVLDSPRTVTSVIAGHSYKATVYVRAGATASVGKSIQVKIREWNMASGGIGTFVKEAVSPALTLTTAFQPITVTLPGQQSSNQLDVRTSLGSPTTQDVLDLDAFTLVDLNQ